MGTGLAACTHTQIYTHEYAYSLAQIQAVKQLTMGKRKGRIPQIIMEGRTTLPVMLHMQHPAGAYLPQNLALHGPNKCKWLGLLRHRSAKVHAGSLQQ